MRAFDLARRLLSTSAILFFGAIAISIMTRDEWLVLAHAASVVSAVIAASGALVLIAAGLRWLGERPAQVARSKGPVDHEQGQTGWD